MATSSHAQAVKSLNQSSGRRRFVFKSIPQRIEEIDINVSLDKVKAKPSEGSSFFRECLIEWKELNTAEDFITFYEEMNHIVQSLQALPLILVQKEVIFKKLVSRLQIKARLSLEPLFRLLAALARDILEDFIPFLPIIVKSVLSLLNSGGNKDPDIVKEVFTSWSQILMYLQKYLVRDILSVLKGTRKLRYYPKDYIQNKMAEATSLLLRNAPDAQLAKGVRKIMLEVAKEPVLERKSGAAALLYHVMMRGTSSSFHSRAERVLSLLMGRRIHSVADNVIEGTNAVVEVVNTALQRLLEELESGEVDLIWQCLFLEINKCVTNKSLAHLSSLLTILISTVEIERGRKVPDYRPMIEHGDLLVSTFIASSGSMEGEDKYAIVDKVLQLALCILDGLHSFNDMASITRCSQQWAPVFALRNSSLSAFIHKLLQKDLHIVEAFKVHILSSLNDLIESSPEEATYILLTLCTRLQVNCSNFDNTSMKSVERIRTFLEEGVNRTVQDITLGTILSKPFDKPQLAALWGIVTCFPNFQANSSLLIDLMDAVRDHILTVESEYPAGITKESWQSLLGAALRSCYNLYSKQSEDGETTKVLHICHAYKSSLQVLSTGADYMDFVHGAALVGDSGVKAYHPELKAEKAAEAFKLFSENLRHSNKKLRLTTLRILCHYEPLRYNTLVNSETCEKTLETEESLALPGLSNVLHLLLSIEETPLSHTNSRKVVLLISRIQMDIHAERVCKTYVPLVLNGIIGIFHNRYSEIWDAASKCLAVLISKHVALVWDEFTHYFGQCQAISGTSIYRHDSGDSNLSEKHADLVELFDKFNTSSPDSTPTSSATVISWLLRSLQKVPFIVESKSRQIIPLFLKFLGYNSENISSVGLFDRCTCKGKEWKGVLKEWLDLLKLMRNPKSLYQSQFVKDVLQNRLLDDNDTEIQMKVLECLLLWKDDFLCTYEQHMKNLISPKDLREEVTKWSLSKESNQIEGAQRGQLVPYVIRLLVPKVRKLKTLASRKHTSKSHRQSVLSFIAQLDADELPLFFVLLIKPLHVTSEDIIDMFWTSSDISLDAFRAMDFLKYFTVETILALSWKKKYGFLHVIQHVLEVFDEFHVTPFLKLLMGCVVRVLLSCTLDLEASKEFESLSLENDSPVKLTSHRKDHAVTHVLTSTSLKQLKGLRSLCLKVISSALKKYEDHDFDTEFWNLFFTSVKPLIKGFRQEGSSSEKPSSLLSCFVAMSKSHRLVTLLHREGKLVPDIFSIITVSTASDAVKCHALEFIENLVNLDNELGGEDNVVKGVLVPNIEELVDSLHCLFQRKSVKYLGEKEVRIFKLLSKYLNKPVQANKCLDVLLSFVARRVKDTDICLEALKIVLEIVPLVEIHDTTRILNKVSPLLVTADLEMRLYICNLFDVLAKVDSSLLIMAKIVRELNATSAMEIDGLDYDTIATTYENFDVNFFMTVQEEHALLILSQGVYHMSSEELTLRLGAYRLLHSFVEFSAKILHDQIPSQFEYAEKMTTINESSWSRASVLRIVNKFLLKHIGDAMSYGSSIKKVWTDLLREMVLKLPDVADLGSFKALCSDDAEVDFFNNIVHLQKHRRAKALKRFGKVISEVNLSQGVVKKVFIPFFFNVLLDAQDGKDENARDACMKAIASISAGFGWTSYYALLSRCFRKMTMNPDKQKILLRLICSILGKFHFLEASLDQEAEDSLHDSSNGATAVEIRTCLREVVLPKIQKLMTSDSDNVNVDINVTALKLLKLLEGDKVDPQPLEGDEMDQRPLEEDKMHPLLPTIIHRISNFLKSRMESIRDEARRALISCLKELGPEYLKFIVTVLRATLKRGYELHVLGYTLNFILTKFLLTFTSANLDYCLEDLLSVVANDILGEVAEEKEVDKIASKMKETRKRKSLESLKLIAQSITFESHALKLLAPVDTHLHKHLTPKMKAKLRSMLDNIAAGIELNPSVNQKNLFLFVYGRIKKGIDEENGLGDSASIVKDKRDYMMEKKISKSPANGSMSGSHLLTVFALELLQSRVKNAKSVKNNEELLSMLDPFIILLGNCLSSKYEDIMSSTLKCLALLVRLPLPAIGSQADKIKATLLNIAQSTVNSDSPVVQSCLRLLMILLKSTKVTLTTDQLRMLIQFPIFVDLERNPSLVALSLLKSILIKKLDAPEIYDIMIQVQNLMVTSQTESIRKKCKENLSNFLNCYTLSDKRKQEHIDKLLGNLRYEHSSGREAVLEMLSAIITKYKKEKLDQQSMSLFFPLFICLANDPDNRVRRMTSTLITLLVKSVSSNSVDAILECNLHWYLDREKQLCGPAAQVVGLLVGVMKENFGKYVDRVLQEAEVILQSAADVADHKQQDLSEQVTVPRWKEAYYSLVLLEKLLQQFPNLNLKRELEHIWEAVCNLLQHPHTWVRRISCRLISFHFGAMTEVQRKKPQTSLSEFYLMKESRLFMVAVYLFSQLKAPLMDDPANCLIAQNLTFTISGLHTLIGQTDWSQVGQHEHEMFFKAFQLLDPTKGSRMYQNFKTAVHGENDQGKINKVQKSLVLVLLKRIAKAALEMDDVQTKIIFNTFRSLSSQISREDCCLYASTLLLPLYKVCEGFAGKVISDDVKQLAEEVYESIRNSLGINTFVQVHSEIRKTLKAKRDKRKEEEKIMAATDPQRNAKRKAKLAEKHRENKRRKLQRMKPHKRPRTD